MASSSSREFAIIKSQAGLNSYDISVKEWLEKTNSKPPAMIIRKSFGLQPPRSKTTAGQVTCAPPFR
jgi:hypothetical protein